MSVPPSTSSLDSGTGPNLADCSASRTIPATGMSSAEWDNAVIKMSLREIRKSLTGRQVAFGWVEVVGVGAHDLARPA